MTHKRDPNLDIPFLTAMSQFDRLVDHLFFYMIALMFISDRKLWKKFNKYAKEKFNERDQQERG